MVEIATEKLPGESKEGTSSESYIIFQTWLHIDATKNGGYEFQNG